MAGMWSVGGGDEECEYEQVFSKERRRRNHVTHLRATFATRHTRFERVQQCMLRSMYDIS